MNAPDAELRCRCGKVRGQVKNASPQTVNRIICYCDDCQAFLHYLGRADLLDAQGGTDIVQVAPAALTFVGGQEQIVGVRLGPKGLYRWYATCCHTPLGNTVVPAVPFVGIVSQGFAADLRQVDRIFGKPIGAIQGKFAFGNAPEGSVELNPRLLLRSIRAITGWRLRGRTWPHPFFDRATRAPQYPLTTLSPVERNALRPLCGPQPTARA
jgi:hypothetical protein